MKLGIEKKRETEKGFKDQQDPGKDKEDPSQGALPITLLKQCALARRRRFDGTQPICSSQCLLPLHDSPEQLRKPNSSAGGVGRPFRGLKTTRKHGSQARRLTPALEKGVGEGERGQADFAQIAIDAANFGGRTHVMTTSHSLMVVIIAHPLATSCALGIFYPKVSWNILI